MSHVRVLSILHIKLKQIPSSHRRISDQQQLSFECSRFGKTQKVKQYMEPSLQKEGKSQEDASPDLILVRRKRGTVRNARERCPCGRLATV